MTNRQRTDAAINTWNDRFIKDGPAEATTNYQFVVFRDHRCGGSGLLAIATDTFIAMVETLARFQPTN